MKIVDRDVELMSWILEQKFMTREQIRNVFWKEESKKSVEEYRRLNELEREGYLRRSAKSFYRNVLYLVTAKGVSLLKSFGKHQGLGELYDVGYSQYKHDVAVTDLRILFYWWGYREWVSERVLSKRNDLRYLPDGMIHHCGKNFAIEYESTLKSKYRYREIFLHYEFENQLERVLYVVDSEEMVGKLGQQNICDKLHFTTIKNLQEHQLNAQLKVAKSFSSIQTFFGGNA